jgi:hypothetical protein
MLLENQRKDETGRILAARRFQARSTGSMRRERAIKTKPPGPSCEDRPGGVSCDGSEDLVTDRGDQAMTFLPESSPRASEVITSPLPFSVEPLPLPLPFWLSARSTMLGDVVWLLCAGAWL